MKMNISDLPNLGTKSQQMLQQAGIKTVEQLRELGAVRAYIQVKQSGANASLNLLWAMEGALTGRHWREVAHNDRLRLLLELEDAERTSAKPKKISKQTEARAFRSAAVAKTFDSYPSHIRQKLFTLRELIYQTATEVKEIGELEETLKWGEPAYITVNKSGSTIRLGWKKSTPTQYAMYFHCQTNLIETFRTLFPTEFKFEGNRAIVFDENDLVPMDSLAFCIASALTYHRNKTRRQGCQ
jgi:hypothetical protein